MAASSSGESRDLIGQDWLAPPTDEPALVVVVSEFFKALAGCCAQVEASQLDYQPVAFSFLFVRRRDHASSPKYASTVVSTNALRQFFPRRLTMTIDSTRSGSMSRCLAKLTRSTSASSRNGPGSKRAFPTQTRPR